MKSATIHRWKLPRERGKSRSMSMLKFGNSRRLASAPVQPQVTLLHWLSCALRCVVCAMCNHSGSFCNFFDSTLFHTLKALVPLFVFLSFLRGNNIGIVALPPDTRVVFRHSVLGQDGNRKALCPANVFGISRHNFGTGLHRWVGSVDRPPLFQETAAQTAAWNAGNVISSLGEERDQRQMLNPVAPQSCCLQTF